MDRQGPHIARLLAADLINGPYPIGSRLPVEADLSARQRSELAGDEMSDLRNGATSPRSARLAT